VPIVLPPLRERREDIPLLIDYFLKKIVDEEGHQPLAVSADAMKIFEKYDWPGNVREMENLIERLVALTEGTTITPENIPAHVRQNTGPKPSAADPDDSGYHESVLNGKLSLEEAESEFNREIIINALEKSAYVQSRAAKMLGITRRILKYKMDKLGITAPEENGL
jgi:transcriptional regulator with GAF, ATPase, and Fis domain